MKPRYQVSRAAIDLIKRFEGYRRKAAQLPDGRWTIGYGHTLTAREGAEVSESDAEALLLYDLIAIAHVVNENVYTPLTQNQFDALACFAFNIGGEHFRRSSVLRRINEGALLQAACAMEMWRKADFEGERIVIDALVRRRSAEKTLFLTPRGGWTPAPSPILRPLVDYDAVSGIPLQTPASVTASLEGERAIAERQAQSQTTPPPVAPTASELAAASVGARLEQILPEEEAAPEPEPAAEPEPETLQSAEDAAFTLTPPAETEAAPAPEMQEEPAPAEDVGPSLFESAIANEPEARVQPAMDEADLRRLVLQDEAAMHAAPVFADDTVEQGRGQGLALLGLAAVGLAFFAGGLFWTIYAQGGEGLLSPMGVGWALVIVGVLCMGLSIIAFLKRLGDEEDDEEDEGA